MIPRHSEDAILFAWANSSKTVELDSRVNCPFIVHLLPILMIVVFIQFRQL